MKKGSETKVTPRQTILMNLEWIQSDFSTKNTFPSDLKLQFHQVTNGHVRSYNYSLEVVLIYYFPFTHYASTF